MRRVVEFPVVLCLMVMSSGTTAMALDRVVVGAVMVAVGVAVGTTLVGWYDHRNQEQP